MTWIVINGDTLTFVGKFAKYTECVVIDGTTLKDRVEPSIVCELESGASWSQLTEMEAGMLCKNSGIEFVLSDYPGNLQKLRKYAEDMEVTTITPEQLELFNEPMNKLRGDEALNPPPSPWKGPVSDLKPKAKPQSRPPSSKGATGRVWAIADEIRGGFPDMLAKELRKHVIQACVEAGIHEATAATQWSKWKKDRGIT